MQLALAGGGCEVASSSSVESMKTDSVAFEEGFQTRLGADAD